MRRNGICHSFFRPRGGGQGAQLLPVAVHVLLPLLIAHGLHRHLHPLPIVAEILKNPFMKLHHGFQPRMYVKNILHGFPQSLQVHAPIQLKKERQVRGGIAPHDIGKIELEVGQRVDLLHREIHRFLLLCLPYEAFQRQHCRMAGKVI